MLTQHWTAFSPLSQGIQSEIFYQHGGEGFTLAGVWSLLFQALSTHVPKKQRFGKPDSNTPNPIYHFYLNTPNPDYN